MQETKLFEAKLVRTNLDQANSSNAHLTGAYIENWGITRKTRLDEVRCEYVISPFSLKT
ncbi:pentapeptide repeat-containing protein [Hydrococcus rivularis]|uniref:pentapeptide repeat-containing protein n=1 Tax=Hydrococcus rivularis TaxID=1616834 RepID=UPI000AAEE775